LARRERTRRLRERPVASDVRRHDAEVRPWLARGRGLLRLLIEKETVSLPGEPDEVALILYQLEAQPPLERH
jgi:hypothetical protein